MITDAAVTDYASHFVDQLMGYTDMICFDFDKVSGPVIVDYLNQTDDGIVLLRLRDMTKNTIYAFSHSAAMNGLSEDSRIVSITPWWSITLKVLIAVFAIMTIAFIGLYVRGEVKRSSDAGKEEKK